MQWSAEIYTLPLSRVQPFPAVKPKKGRKVNCLPFVNPTIPHIIIQYSDKSQTYFRNSLGLSEIVFRMSVSNSNIKCPIHYLELHLYSIVILFHLIDVSNWESNFWNAVFCVYYQSWFFTGSKIALFLDVSNLGYFPVCCLTYFG